MLRFFRRVAWLGMLAAGLPAAQAYSLLGPAEPYQVPDLGYMIALRGDLGAPKDISQEYRRNTPVLYYAFDRSFIEFFGTHGMQSIDAAFAILNALTNVSSYSSALTEVPLEAKRFNQTAGALNLLDLKSTTLGILVEQLGLADSVRYTWTLHSRSAGGNCPDGNQYTVVKRNFAIEPSPLDQYQYSSYVNGVLFSYYIQEYCANPPAGSGLSEAVEIPVDVLENALRFTPVSSFSFGIPGGLYTGLTRDDIAGLRYLLRFGNANMEDSPPNSISFFTNNTPGNLALLVTSNLTLLAAASLTNNDAALQALYPGLAITPGSMRQFFTNIVTTNIITYFTNYPTDPYPLQRQVVTKTYTTNWTFAYTRSFDNVVTQSFSPVTFVTVISSNITHPPDKPFGTVETNGTITTYLTNAMSGEYYLTPSNLCGVYILSNVFTTTTAVTNSLIATNSQAAGTNSSTNVIGDILLSQSIIYWYTNHNLAYYPVVCSSNGPALRRGIEKITFVKTAFDSQINPNYYPPQTNFFTMTIVTNSTNWTQTYQRVVTAPDILFSATDMVPGPAGAPPYFDVSRSLNFGPSSDPGQPGPGLISTPTTITFNSVQPVFYNFITNNVYAMDEQTAVLQAAWASYDESTNAPIVYPNGTSIQSVESQMLMAVTSISLPPAHRNASYSAQLTGTGGAPPYTWSVATNSPAKPEWLSLAPNGRLSGTPTAPNVYYFFVQMTGTDLGFTVQQVVLTVLP